MSSRRCIDVAGKKGSAFIQLKWLSISYSLFCLNTARSVSGSGVCLAFIALGLLAIVGNLMEPSKASF